MNTSPVQDTPARALGVALAVAVVCALAVSLAAVTLRPLYLANQDQERVGRLTAILGEIFPGVAEAERTPTIVAMSDWEGGRSLLPRRLPVHPGRGQSERHGRAGGL